MAHICKQCGGRSFRFNDSKLQIECDLCRSPLQTPQDEHEIMEFYQTYTQAMNYLKAGFWKRTIRLLMPFVGKYPCEKRIYYGLLLASTKNFKDLKMDNIENREIACNAWMKLVRLNGVTNEMLNYSRQCYEEHRKERSEIVTKLLKRIFSAALCSILAGIYFVGDCYFYAVLCIGGMAVYLYKVFKSHPVKVIKNLRDPIHSFRQYKQNPFVCDGFQNKEWEGEDDDDFY